MLENERLTKLAELLFVDDEVRSKDISANFEMARVGFIECWLHVENVHFYYRLAALRMAFFADVYRHLTIEKNVEQLKVEDYFASVLTNLAKRTVPTSPKVFDVNRKRQEQDIEAVMSFGTELLLFTDEAAEVLVRKAINRQNQTEKLTSAEVKDIVEWVTNVRQPIVRKPTAESIKDVVEWLTHARLVEDAAAPKQLSLMIVRKPMVLAESIIKDVYRKRFKECKPSDIQFRIKSNQTIGNGGESCSAEELSKLIDDGLTKHRLVVITGI